uniref:Uncharacterized protein n=1 Tax=Mycena chlorophos TaxID=658473 RepID=A0ABQ0L537_MYCCL|nr:predicted protein [Mycena chlorophos]
MKNSSSSKQVLHNDCERQDAVTAVDAYLSLYAQQAVPFVDPAEHGRLLGHLAYEQSQLKEHIADATRIRAEHENEIASLRHELDTVKEIAASRQGVIDTQATKLTRLRRVLRDRVGAHDAEVLRLQEQSRVANAKYAALLAAVGGTRVAVYLTRAKIVEAMGPVQTLLKWLERVARELGDGPSRFTNADGEA